VLAASGHCITARWHVGPLCGEHFWSVLVTSPEVLVFLFLMITDPKTAPRGRRARVIFGALIALLAVFLAAPQHTEFQTKLALLAALAVACAVRPLLEKWFADGALRTDAPPVRRDAPTRVRRAAVALASVTAAVVLLVGAGAPARTIPPAPSAAVSPRNCAQHTVATIRRRPTVPVGAALVARTTIGVPTNVSGTISLEKGQEIARDVVADLTIIGRAVSRRDIGLAATAAASPFLDLLRRDICAPTARAPAPIAATNRFKHNIRVSLYKRTLGQVSAEIDVDVRAANPRRGTTFRVEPHDGAYLIAAIVER
jgi:hypothetical protein